MLNKNFKSKVVIGLASVALFAPLALPNGSAHASDLDNFFSKQAGEAAIQHGRQEDQAKQQWADKYGSEYDGKGVDGKQVSSTNNDASSATDDSSTSSSSSQSNSPVDKDDDPSYTPVSNSGTPESESSSNKSKAYQKQKNTPVTYPNQPKSKEGRQANSKQIAKKLVSYDKDIYHKSNRDELKKLTKNNKTLSSHKKQLAHLDKFVHGNKNKANFAKEVNEL